MKDVEWPVRFWVRFGEFAMQASEAALTEIGSLSRRRRLKRGGYRTVRPGPDTPMWNLCSALLRAELRPRGAKVRLARYLGLPRQRITDFLTGRRRMPDAETLLRMLHWVAHKRGGTDLSV